MNALPSPFQRCLQVPVLGVGLGVDVYDARPGLKALLAQREGFDFLELYTRGDAEFSDGPLSSLPADLPRTYHHEGLDPVGPRLPPAENVAGCVKNLGLCKAPWCVEELAVRHINGLYTDFFFPALLNRESLKASVANLRALQQRVPAPLLPENAPYEFVVGDMHLLDYLREVSHGADCGVVMDLGHLFSYQLCVGKADKPLDGIERMDLSRVIEVHLAGARLERYPGGLIYRDLHGAGPIPRASLEMLRILAPRLPNLRAVTIEVEDAPLSRALKQVRQVREILASVRPDFRGTRHVA